MGTAIDLAGYADIQLAEFADGQVVFSPTQQLLAFVLYTIDPPTDNVIELSAEGDGDLWLLALDFADGYWSAISQFVDGEASIDLTAMGQPLSPAGLLHFAVVCEAGGAGVLSAATLAYENYIYEWDISAQVAGEGINLFWNAMPFDGYNVYRSALPSDEYGFHVGTVLEVNIGNNSFREELYENEDGQWRYVNRDNGTPEDPSDDFPSLAPAIKYYYYIVPLLDGAELSVRSPEVSATIPWGGRLIVHREFPDATDRTYFMADELSSEVMTDAQAEFAAGHYIGAAVIDEQGLEMVRTYNPGFIGLKSVMVNPAGPELDFAAPGSQGSMPDYYWPYIDRHESWFGHNEASENLNNRIRVFWGPDDYYFMDPATEWADYIIASGLQQLGEDLFDGLFLNNLNGWLGTDPDNFGFPGEYWEAMHDAYDWLIPRFGNLAGKAVDSSAALPSRPMLVAETWLYPDLFGEIDYSPLDAAYIDHQFDGSDVPESMGGSWDVAMDYQIGKLRYGQGVMFTHRPWPGADFNTMFYYCSYLLQRQGKAYFYNRYYPNTSSDNVPHWAGLFDWETGAAIGEPPGSMDDLLVTGDGIYGPLYRRDFENGSVLIAFGDSFLELPGGNGEWEFLGYASSGENSFLNSLPVSEFGEQADTINWRPIAEHNGGPSLHLSDECIIIRPIEPE